MVDQPAVIKIVERCQALFEDLDFNAVKEWKAAVPGRKAIGYLPVYVPRGADPTRRGCCRSEFSAAATLSR